MPEKAKAGRWQALALAIAGMTAIAAQMPQAASAQGLFNQRIEPVLRGADKNGARGYEVVRPGAGLPGVFGNNAGSDGGAPVIMAQSGDAAIRMTQMEEQMRQLTGQVEELTFQLLQLQEQIRRMQEDNEYRFQELEGKQGSLRGNSPGGEDGGSSLGKPQPSDPEERAGGSGGNGERRDIGEIIAGEGGGLSTEGAGVQGTPPIDLGTLTFDENGNLVDSNIGAPIDLTGEGNQSAGQANGGAIDPALAGSPDELFDLGFQYVQGGRYEKAIDVFWRFSEEHPDHPRIAEAQFWLGESFFALGRYEDAAQVFLDNHRAHPQAVLGAENLLKLGVSLAGLEQRELACATYAEVGKKYPDVSNAVRMRVAREQEAARCIGG